jgi:hypothetical protein
MFKFSSLVMSLLLVVTFTACRGKKKCCAYHNANTECVQEIAQVDNVSNQATTKELN